MIAPVKGNVRRPHRKLRVAGLFAGIGGLELGMAKAGHETTLLCENDVCASAVLRSRFPGVPLVGDVRELRQLPEGTDLVTAGFPCQDLSQAGETNGIRGKRSGLVSEVFRLLRKTPVPWVLIENVPFMLKLDRGSAIAFIVKELESLGYHWAYRVLDTRAFGLPQRRERVYLLASNVEDPAERLFRGSVDPDVDVDHAGKACGFYWTEGVRGLGWAVDSVPTLKGGSTVGIASPPAIWFPDGRIGTPDIRDAERLQGFSANWTLPATSVGRAGFRWKLVGNAVSVPVARWVGEQIAATSRWTSPGHEVGEIVKGAWPKAAACVDGRPRSVPCSTWPVMRASRSLEEFLQYPVKPLSLKATSGFERRLSSSTLRAPNEFREALLAHMADMQTAER